VREIDDDQLARDGQHREQHHGPHLHDAAPPLGRDEQGAVELEREDRRVR
jgi:hypothetical protein